MVFARLMHVSSLDLTLVNSLTYGVAGNMASGRAKATDNSPLDLKRRIIACLSQRGVSSVRHLNIEVKDGTVTFRGTVRSFYERQLCLCCQYVPGVRKVVDDLTVQLPSKGTSIAGSLA